MDEKIKLGISACLLGENVRYDGSNKLDRFLAETLGAYVSYVPVCPEVEYGMGVPREPVRLVGEPEDPRMVGVRSGKDHTANMKSWAARRVNELEKDDLCGFIFKSRSPSSGMERVKVYGPDGNVSHKGVGMFARAFMEHFPLVPVEEEGRLHDPKLRETFIELVFTLKRWRGLLAKRKSAGALVEFHTVHKLLIMSHSVERYRSMGKLVASAKGMPLDELYAEYQEALVGALRMNSTRKKNANVLMHILGYFKKELTPDEKQEAVELIDGYRLELLPLVVPVTLLDHYVRKYDQPYLKTQVYLHPHPVELQLRNHV